MDKKIIAVLALFFLFLFSLRFAFLDSDPLLFKRMGDAGDEGYWIHSARNMFLFGQLSLDQFNPVILTPLYTGIAFVSFNIFGISFFSIRIIPAFFACLSLLLMFFFVKRHSDLKTAFLATAFLGLSLSFLAFNRLGFIETAQLFFVLLSIYFIGEKKHLFSGLAFGLACLIKVSAVLYLPVLLIILAFEACQKKISAKKIGIFIIALIPFSLVYAALFLFFPDFAYTFFGVTNPQTFTPMNFFFILTNPMFQRIDFYLLLLFSMVFILGLFLKKKLSNLSFLEYSSFIWFFFTIIFVALGDFSDRRFLVLIVPMSIMAALLPSLLPIDFRQVIEKIKEHRLLFLLPLSIGFFSFLNPALATIIPDYYWVVLPLLFLVSLPVFFFLLKKNIVVSLLLSCLFLTPLFAVLELFFAEFNFFVSKAFLKLFVLFLILLFGFLMPRIKFSIPAWNKAVLFVLWINVFFIFLSFAFLSNSLALEAKNIGIPDNETLTGYYSQVLSIDGKAIVVKTGAKPIQSNFNKQAKPDYALVAKGDGSYLQPGYFGNYAFIKEIDLYPEIFTGKPRLELELYRIDYEK